MRCAGKVKGGEVGECDPAMEGRRAGSGTDADRAAIG